MSVRLSNKELARAGTGGSKYRAVRQLCSAGHNHDSKRESARCEELRLLLKAGAIRELRYQVQYEFVVNYVKVCGYRADFVYHEKIKAGWRLVVEDVKGFKKNPTYLLKKKLLLACRGIRITET